MSGARVVGSHVWRITMDTMNGYTMLSKSVLLIKVGLYYTVGATTNFEPKAH
jgi:hypothetical protein